MFENAGPNQFFVCLESGKGRMFASNPSAEVFYKHYCEFEGSRCFYQLNRSVQLDHATKLYLDVEWVTPFRDEKSEVKIDYISMMILKESDCKSQPYVENLVRGCKGQIKNSYHLYFDVWFNDSNDLKGFMKEKI